MLSGLEVIKRFSCWTQLSTKFILLINVKMPTIVGILTFISRINTASERLKARNFFICWYFSFYEQLKFCAQLTWAWKKFYNLGTKHHFRKCLSEFSLWWGPKSDCLSWRTVWSGPTFLSKLFFEILEHLPKYILCKVLTLCMLGNFVCFCHLLIYFKVNLFKNSFQEYHQCQFDS